MPLWKNGVEQGSGGGGGSGGSGLTAAQVNALIQSGVSPWSLVGNASEIPDPKVPASIARDIELATEAINRQTGDSNAQTARGILANRIQLLEDAPGGITPFAPAILGNWTKEASAQAPTSGKFDAGNTRVEISKTDADGNDKSSELGEVIVGHALSVGSDILVITSVNDDTNDVTFLGYWVAGIAENSSDGTSRSVGHIAHETRVSGYVRASDVALGIFSLNRIPNLPPEKVPDLLSRIQTLEQNAGSGGTPSDFSIFYGPSAPAATQGETGDEYIRTNGETYIKRAVDGWTLIIDYATEAELNVERARLLVLERAKYIWEETPVHKSMTQANLTETQNIQFSSVRGIPPSSYFGNNEERAFLVIRGNVAQVASGTEGRVNIRLHTTNGGGNVNHFDFDVNLSDSNSPSFERRLGLTDTQNLFNIPDRLILTYILTYTSGASTHNNEVRIEGVEVSIENDRVPQLRKEIIERIANLNEAERNQMGVLGLNNESRTDALEGKTAQIQDRLFEFKESATIPDLIGSQADGKTSQSPVFADARIGGDTNMAAFLNENESKRVFIEVSGNLRGNSFVQGSVLITLTQPQSGTDDVLLSESVDIQSSDRNIEVNGFVIENFDWNTDNILELGITPTYTSGPASTDINLASPSVRIYVDDMPVKRGEILKRLGTLTDAEKTTLGVGSGGGGGLTLSEIPDASASTKGLVELADDAEVAAKTAADKALVPAHIDDILDDFEGQLHATAIGTWNYESGAGNPSLQAFKVGDDRVAVSTVDTSNMIKRTALEALVAGEGLKVGSHIFIVTSHSTSSAVVTFLGFWDGGSAPTLTGNVTIARIGRRINWGGLTRYADIVGTPDPVTPASAELKLDPVAVNLTSTQMSFRVPGQFSIPADLADDGRIVAIPGGGQDFQFSYFNSTGKQFEINPGNSDYTVNLADLSGITTLNRRTDVDGVFMMFVNTGTGTGKIKFAGGAVADIQPSATEISAGNSAFATISPHGSDRFRLVVAPFAGDRISLIVGTTAPSNTLGSKGDIYYNLSTGGWSQKTATTWNEIFNQQASTTIRGLSKLATEAIAVAGANLTDVLTPGTGKALIQSQGTFSNTTANPIVTSGGGTANRNMAMVAADGTDFSNFMSQNPNKRLFGTFKGTIQGISPQTGTVRVHLYHGSTLLGEETYNLQSTNRAIEFGFYIKEGFSWSNDTIQIRMSPTYTAGSNSGQTQINAGATIKLYVDDAPYQSNEITALIDAVLGTGWRSSGGGGGGAPTAAEVVSAIQSMSSSQDATVRAALGVAAAGHSHNYAPNSGSSIAALLDAAIGTGWRSSGGGSSAPNASEVVRGLIEIANQTEANALSDTTRALTPGRLPWASETQRGVMRFASTAEVQAKTVTDKAITPGDIDTFLAGVSGSGPGSPELLRSMIGNSFASISLTSGKSFADWDLLLVHLWHGGTRGFGIIQRSNWASSAYEAYVNYGDGERYVRWLSNTSFTVFGGSGDIPDGVQIYGLY